MRLNFLYFTLIFLISPHSFGEANNANNNIKCGIFILDNCSAESGFTSPTFGLSSAQNMKTSIQASINSYTKHPASIGIGRINDDQIDLTYLDDKNNKISVSNCTELGNLTPVNFSKRVVDFLNRELILSNSITHFIIPIVNSKSGSSTLILLEKTGNFVAMGRGSNLPAAGSELARNINLCENSVLKAVDNPKIDLASSVLGEKINYAAPKLIPESTTVQKPK